MHIAEIARSVRLVYPRGEGMEQDCRAKEAYNMAKEAYLCGESAAGGLARKVVNDRSTLGFRVFQVLDSV